MKRKYRKRRTGRFAWWLTLRQRWSNTMPKFFKVILCICALVGGTALAVNTAIVTGGGVTHEWWNELYPYLIGIPAGAAFVAKFTQTYGKDGQPVSGKPEKEPEESHNTVLDKDDF
ncbi:MAG: hypothetical protein IKZ87_05385 [Actinomycetaceae bacterium]|nr:hypothetical protein [Actinomycetaceae bacterium]